jgi:hypothetical protein
MVANRASSTATNPGMDAPRQVTFSQPRAEMCATSKPTRSAGRTDCSWPGETRKSGGTAAACTPEGSFPGRRFSSPSSSDRDVASPYRRQRPPRSQADFHRCWIWEDTVHEILIKPFGALSYRHFVNCIAMRPRRYRRVANHTHASQRHGYAAGAAGEAAAAGGACGKHGWSSPERAGDPDDSSSSGRDGSNSGRAAGCAGSCHGEACTARETGQQLQRWL